MSTHNINVFGGQIRKKHLSVIHFVFVEAELVWHFFAQNLSLSFFRHHDMT